MNNLWENSTEQANCNICDNDSVFYMPLKREDLVALRLQVPFQQIINNGGGLPIGASVVLNMTDEIGNVLCTFGGANLGKFILGQTLDATNYIAEYQIYAPVPFNDEFGATHSHYYIDVAIGDTILIPAIGADFIYGVDLLPSSLTEVKAGRLVRSGDPANINTLDTALVNGSVVTQILLYSSVLSCTFEDWDCFRYSLEVTYSTWGTTKTFYTKPFKVERCEDSVMLHGTYPTATIDCNGYKHSSSFNISSIVNPNKVSIRVSADIEREANRITKFYNNRCFNYKAEKTKMHRLKSSPVPEWFADEVENVVMAQYFDVDNLPLMIDASDKIFQNSDVQGQDYQNIDVSLSQCKCENVFVC